MDVFDALAEPKRRHIIELLARKGQLTSGDIAEKFKVTPPAISQHLKILREARLVEMEKQAQKRLYQINPAAIEEISEWARKLADKWNERFEALDRILTAKKKPSYAEATDGKKGGEKYGR